jgi:hypothetical protein
MIRRIDVRDEPIKGVPEFDDEGTPILAPGTSPRLGAGWTLYYRDDSGSVQRFHIPRPWAHDIRQAEVMARHQLDRFGGRSGP